MPYDDDMGGSFNSGYGSASPSKTTTNGSGTSTGWGGSSTSSTKTPSSGSSYGSGTSSAWGGKTTTSSSSSASVNGSGTSSGWGGNDTRGSNTPGSGTSSSWGGNDTRGSAATDSKSAGNGMGPSGGGGWGRDSGPSDKLNAPSSGNNTNPNISNAIAKAINTYSTVNAVKSAANSLASYFGGQGTTSYGKPPNGNTGMYPGRGDYEFMGPVPNAAADRVAAGLTRNDKNASVNGGGGWGRTAPYSSLNAPSTGNNTNPNVSNAIERSIRAAQQSAALQEAARQISRMFGGSGEYGVPGSYDLGRSATSPAQSLADAFAPNYAREISSVISGTPLPSARTFQIDDDIQARTSDPTNGSPIRPGYVTLASTVPQSPAITSGKQFTEQVPQESTMPRQAIPLSPSNAYYVPGLTSPARNAMPADPSDVIGIRDMLRRATEGQSIGGMSFNGVPPSDGGAAPVTADGGVPAEPGLPPQRGGVAPPDAGNVTRPGTVSQLETVNASDWTARMGGRDTSGQQQAQQPPGTPATPPPITDPVAVAVTAGVMPWDISSFLALQRTLQKQGTTYSAADFVRDFYGGSRPLAQASYNPIPPIKTAA